jgi:hypothetical protein
MSVAKLLNEAKNEAGVNAVAAARRGLYRKQREWSSIAVEITKLERRAIEEVAK